ncbi:tektin-3-like [Oratosquilla oratoria]|uniref:tektin-3-like n=1 Tax=Oratosquilla oratoria TaxID=337810 RepID=UPI003F775CEE
MAGLPVMHHQPPSALNKTMAMKTVDTRPFEQSLSLVPPTLSRAYPTDSRVLDSVRFPNIFTSATSTMQTRYTPADWAQNNMSNYSDADNTRGASERIRDDAVRLVGFTYDRTSIAQRESSQRLGERVSDITYWRSELTQELERMLAETNRLHDSRRKLEQALKDTENPFHVTKECLYFRENRQGIDLVRDGPEESLLREVDTIKDCQARMKNLLERVNLQLSRNRAARHDLEHDTMNKNHALTIDHTAHRLHNHSAAITYYPGIERIDNTVSVPESWTEFSNRNIQQSQSERNSSQRMRSEVESLVASTHQEIWSAWSTSNTSLTHRSGESNDTRNRLLAHRDKVQQEMNDLEKHIDLLKKSILDKSSPLQVVHTRLENRTHRPEIELCRDPPQNRMFREVQEISESVEALRRKLADAEEALHRLAQIRARLDHDIGVKTNSLYIDRDKCLSIRKSFPLSQPHLVDFAIY